MRHDFASNIRNYDPHKGKRKFNRRKPPCAKFRHNTELCKKKKKKKNPSGK